MKLLSVNIGKEETLTRPNKTEQTGIFKRPVSGPVQVTALGIPGDFIGDKKHHGGPDQAIYIYGQGDYDWWQDELGRPLPPGTFGENLTISDLTSPIIRIGDRLHIGGVILEVTAPRIPCGTLAGAMGLPDFAKRFRFAGRPGLYCRVLQAGVLQAGDAVRLEPYPGPTVTILDVMRDHYEPDLSAAAIRRFLDAPIAIRMRHKKEEQWQALQGGAHG
ncbi:MAG: MOSC domain-containing protein [Anaerolineales bacterium]